MLEVPCTSCGHLIRTCSQKKKKDTLLLVIIFRIHSSVNKTFENFCANSKSVIIQNVLSSFVIFCWKVLLVILVILFQNVKNTLSFLSTHKHVLL